MCRLALGDSYCMSNPPHQDDVRLQPVVDQIGEAEMANAKAFDKAILTLSSGALALSFVFVKDIVPITISKNDWLLYASWIFFILALVVNITGYMFALRGFRNHWRMALQVFRHRTESGERLQLAMESHRDALYRFNALQGLCFIAGVVTFAAYVMTNFYSEARMVRSKSGNAFTKAQPSTGFVPSNPKGTPLITGDAMPSAAYIPSKPQAAPATPPAALPSNARPAAATTSSASAAAPANPVKK